jgi:hypothetical protein
MKDNERPRQRNLLPSFVAAAGISKRCAPVVVCSIRAGSRPNRSVATWWNFGPFSALP